MKWTKGKIEFDHRNGNFQAEIVEFKSKMTKMKNSLEGLINRFELAEERDCELEDRSIDIIQPDKKEEKQEKRNMHRTQEGAVGKPLSIPT